MTLYSSISILRWISWIFGVFPFHKTTKFLNLITLSYICLFTFCLIGIIVQRTSSLREIASGNYYKSNMVSNFGLLFHFISGTVVFYTIYVCSLFKSGGVKKALEILHEIDETLMNLGQKFDYFRNKIFTTTVYFSGLITILLILTLQATNIQREKLNPLSVNMWFALAFPLIISNILTTQFSFTVLGINNRLKKINEQLKRLDGRNYILTLHKIEILMKLYNSLCDMAKLTNHNYMIQLFVTLTNQYGVILFSVFYCYWMINIKPFSSICWVCWALFKTYEIMLVIVPCQMLSVQARYTGKLIRMLLLKRWNCVLRKKLLVYSQHLQEQTIEFTIFGCATVDATLLFRIIEGSSTYVIIMVQMEQSVNNSPV